MARSTLYLDANALIALFEERDRRIRESLVGALSTVASRVHLVTSEITVSEILVGAMRDKDQAMERFYIGLFEPSDTIETIPVDRGILLETARLRSVSSMRLADGIHVATAIKSGATGFLSNDKRIYLPSGIRQVRVAADAISEWASA